MAGTVALKRLESWIKLLLSQLLHNGKLFIQLLIPAQVVESSEQENFSAGPENSRRLFLLGRPGESGTTGEMVDRSR